VSRSRSRHAIERPFVGLPLSLVGGVSVNALSLTAVRVLMRLIAEHLTHGGAENGRLRVSYKQFAVRAGVKESEIAGALAELVDLGFVEIVHGWRPAGAAKLRPNIYRLTFLPDYEYAAPTNEWKRLEPSKGADDKAWREALARAKTVARAARVRRRQSGKGSFRSEEAAAAAEPSEALLKRVGKEKVGRPGNKQTRAALNEHNNSKRFAPRGRSYVDHGPDRTVEKPGGNGADRTVEGHDADRTVPSTTSVSLATSAAKRWSGGDSGASKPTAEPQPTAVEPADTRSEVRRRTSGRHPARARTSASLNSPQTTPRAAEDMTKRLKAELTLEAKRTVGDEATSKRLQ
jgi:hypothetical protein